MLDNDKTLLPTMLQVGSVDTPPLVTNGGLKLIIEAIMNESKKKFIQVDTKLSNIENSVKNHNQSSNTITAMTGYSKAAVSTGITPDDNLNTAIGKLEKGLDGKQPVGNYSTNGHTHDDRYFTESEINSKLSGYQPKGNYAVLGHTHAIENITGLNNKFNNIFIGGTSRVVTDFKGTIDQNLKSGFYRINGANVGLSGGVAIVRIAHPTDNYALTLLSPYGSNNLYFSPNVDASKPIKLANFNDLDTKLDKGAYEGTAADLKSEIDGKASSSHKHMWGEILQRPDRLPSPGSLNIKIKDITTSYDGHRSIDLTISPESIGAQVAGSYASASHNHDNFYSKLGHKHSSSDITSLDASKITSGTIDIARLPAAALERLVVVANDTERFKLTKDNVQVGDSVKVTATLKMYRVIDDNKLSTEDGYSVYVAGRAAEVPWSGVTGKPSTYPPNTHNHTWAQISDRPSSLKNPTALSIQLNGNNTTTYDGSAAKTINITPASIGAQVAGSYASASHNHDNAYTKVGHTHDDRYFTESEINSKLSAYQPKGSYAASNHNHDTTYIKAQASEMSFGGREEAMTTAAFLDLITSKGAFRQNYWVSRGTWSYAGNIYISDSGLGNIHLAGAVIEAYGSSKTCCTVKITMPTTSSSGGTNEDFIYVNNGNVYSPGWRKLWNSKNFNPNDKANVNHTHDDRYFTESEINSKLSGYQPKGSYASASHNHDTVYAKLSHGTHIPSPQSANNSIFLRNDNTWQRITPENIGAAAASHSHPYLPLTGGNINGTITVSGNVTAANVLTTSDIRLKHDIQKIDNPMSKVLGINGYTFIKDGDKQRTTGLIAQEVQRVLPEAVFETEDKYLGVTYGNIVGLLIEAIKELKTEIDSLKRR